MSIPIKSVLLEHGPNGQQIIPTPVACRHGMVARIKLIGRRQADGSFDPRPCGRCRYPFFGYDFINDRTEEGYWICEACGYEGLRGSSYEIIATLEYVPGAVVPPPQRYDDENHQDAEVVIPADADRAARRLIDHARRERIIRAAELVRNVENVDRGPYFEYVNFPAAANVPWIVQDNAILNAVNQANPEGWGLAAEIAEIDERGLRYPSLPVDPVGPEFIDLEVDDDEPEDDPVEDHGEQDDWNEPFDEGDDEGYDGP